MAQKYNIIYDWRFTIYDFIDNWRFLLKPYCQNGHPLLSAASRFGEKFTVGKAGKMSTIG